MFFVFQHWLVFFTSFSMPVLPRFLFQCWQFSWTVSLKMIDPDWPECKAFSSWTLVSCMAKYSCFLIVCINFIFTFTNWIFYDISGISFFPIPNYKSTLVKYQVSKQLSYQKYIVNIGDNLEKINSMMNKNSARFAKCNLTSDTKIPNDPMKTCKFDAKLLGACNSKDDYGYKAGTPCIFVKMNRVCITFVYLKVWLNNWIEYSTL